LLELYINVSYDFKEDMLEQHFSFLGNKRNNKYLRDQKFHHYRLLWEKIRDYSINNKHVEFSNVKSFDDEVVLYYRAYDQKTIKNFLKESYIFCVSSNVPKTTGCAFCKFKNELHSLSGFFRCEYLEKTLTSEKKTCKWFIQKEEIST
jgi:hypothetical protein